MNRRKFLGASLATFFTFSSASKLAAISNTVSAKKKSFRVVHFTDMHIYPHKKVQEKMEMLVQEVNNLSEKPDFILNTGDNVMDSLKRSKTEVQKQWEAWHSYFRDKINFPVHSCIGNHDVWGWGLNKKEVKSDPLYGKNWAVQSLGINNRFYAFEHKGWKFICLDSPYYSDNGHAYTAKLDNEQFSWLASELENTNLSTPICIASHIPVLSASVFFDGNNNQSGNWKIPGSWMHIDAIKIKDLLYKYPNVKTAISGHVHLVDKTEYLGVDYQCNGAVCGAWWKGDYHEFSPAYAIVDFYSDGSVSTELVNYDKR